ncbi:glycosyltransferase family 4 protein [Segatella copri]|jgi:glycosyltransferase involved in cell wall biosynthesis|uniref:Glycosyltransferase n=1 Tax=Segatella copri TaxID=165179 RepID=A0AA92U6R6_9BACT|nr:glycosyltransferase family 4 protein [Segatella copri]RGW69535.1 glycosyltransferase [Segatella copri]
MKVAYISTPHLADCDIPLIGELQKKINLFYFLKVSESTKRLTLIKIESLNKRGGVYPASDFPELAYLANAIDLSKTYIVNLPGKHDWSISNLLTIFRMVCVILHKKINIVHLTWPPRYGEFFTYLLRKRIVITMHDPLPHSSEDTWLNRLHRDVCFRLLNDFILLNETQKEDFIKTYHMGAKRVVLSHLSAYTNLQNIKPQKPDVSNYVVFFGGISSHKGIEYLCEAMDKVCKKHPDVKLVVAGKGKIYFDLNQYAIYSNGHLVLLNRYLDDTELVGLIRSSLFVVCPYVDATQSGVIMSAFALNKPVIATNVGALPSMVKNGLYGTIVPPRDVTSLATAINTLIEDPQKIEAMTENIKHDYSKGKYSWNAIAQGITDIYTKKLSTFCNQNN